LIAGEKAFFARMVVDAILHLDEELDLNMIGIKKESGGGLLVRASFYIRMHAFTKSNYQRNLNILRVLLLRRPSLMQDSNNNLKF